MARTLRNWSLAFLAALATLGAAGCVYPVHGGYGAYRPGYSSGYHGGVYYSSPRVYHAPPRTVVVAPPPRPHRPEPPRVSHPPQPQHRAEHRPSNVTGGPVKPQGQPPRHAPEKRYGGQ